VNLVTFSRKSRQSSERSDKSSRKIPYCPDYDLVAFWYFFPRWLTFNEYNCIKRKDNYAENFALIRKMALLKNEKSKNASIRRKD
jgi:hypothetical protein